MPPLGLLIDDTGPKKAAALAFYMFSAAVVCLQRFAGHEGHGSLFERKKTQRIWINAECLSEDGAEQL